MARQQGTAPITSPSSVVQTGRPPLTSHQKQPVPRSSSSRELRTRASSTAPQETSTKRAAGQGRGSRGAAGRAPAHGGVGALDLGMHIAQEAALGADAVQVAPGAQEGPQLLGACTCMPSQHVQSAPHG